jgi:hypothetical protein
MARSATEIMHDIVLAAVLDGVAALRASSGGMPNTLLRNLNAIHANTTFADLPKELQDAINASVRTAFNKLLKEGYSVTGGSAPPPRAPAHGRESAPRGPRRSPPSGKPGGGRPDGRGPRSPGSARPEGNGPRDPGGKPPRGPRPPRSR